MLKALIEALSAFLFVPAKSDQTKGRNHVNAMRLKLSSL